MVRLMTCLSVLLVLCLKVFAEKISFFRQVNTKLKKEKLNSKLNLEHRKHVGGVQKEASCITLMKG